MKHPTFEWLIEYCTDTVQTNLVHWLYVPEHYGILGLLYMYTLNQKFSCTQEKMKIFRWRQSEFYDSMQGRAPR